ncbi:hypothetical protein PVL29_013930 [Vitis rotundifolia]|uniref:Tubulin--tyrosine ligase-like protein 12 SET-like domain-containing protein n=1 Tax=Vitis rotundifolia TaxID=103349 RepID=A0AA39DKP6_VITRO|nr:hypothetical protein PVL29_013930 [Vitis rotundifolia]
MAADRIVNFEDFVKVHALLLQASGLPPSLHRQLFQKLYSETFDSGDFFQVQPCEDGRRRRLVLTSDSMEKESHVFLIDHAWTFRLSDAPKQLQEVPGLAERMASLMCVDIDMDSNSEEIDAVNGGSDEKDTKLDVMRMLGREISEAEEKGDGIVMWLELDELGIDDDMLLSLDLSRKFPVCNPCILNAICPCCMLVLGSKDTMRN